MLVTLRKTLLRSRLVQLTELSIVQDVLVEQDNTGTQGNPDTDNQSV